MKLIATAIVGIALLGGCKTNPGPAQPLAPGFTNSVDQSLGETLAAARAFYSRLQLDATAGTFKPSAAETQALNGLSAAINAAEPVYLAYHAGTGSQAAAQAAIDAVTQKQAAVTTIISAVQP